MRITLYIVLFVCILFFVSVYANSSADTKAEQNTTQEKEIQFKKSVGTGFDFSFSVFLPSGKRFNDLYPQLYGLSVNYVHMLFRNFSINGGLLFFYRNHQTKTGTFVFINSYSIGIRYYFPILDTVFPYIGILGRVTWCGEKDPYQFNKYFGYGGDPFAGVSVEIMNSLDIFVQYNFMLSKVADSSGTNISGHFVSLGCMYKM